MRLTAFAARVGLLAFAVASVLLAASTSRAAAAPFEVTKLGGYDSYAIAINDNGQVAGNTGVIEPGGEQRIHPFFWTRAGGMIDLGADAGYDSAAFAMNNKGEVVGYGHYHGSEQAFAWTRDGGRVALGSLPGVGDVPIPTAVNDSGQVVGRQADHGFSWTPTGGMVDIGSLSEGGAGTAAEAVSNSGQVVGRSGPYAFSWTKAGGMVNLGALPGRSITAARAVNRKGQVVGFSGGSGAVEHAFSWTSSGGVVDLGALPGGDGRSEATALNDNGQVIGFSSAQFGSGAFSWTAAGGMVDLGHVPGTDFTSAAAVNNAGQVVGAWGNMPDSHLLGGESHAFSWTATGGLIPLPPLRGTGLGEWAVAVNNRGQVAGVSVLAVSAHALQNAVIWSPTNQATSGDDTLTGTSGPNVICGLGGNDTIRGLGGNDTLFGDACGVKSKLVSAAASGGNDVLGGGKGNDKLYGGRGNDKLNGGPGVNSYSGGSGNDTINARNGKKETVDCGSGKKDVAIVDKRDKTKGCEKVRRPKK